VSGDKRKFYIPADALDGFVIGGAKATSLDAHNNRAGLARLWYGRLLENQVIEIV
jgi:hypothetical protein